MAGGLSAHLWFRASKIGIPSVAVDSYDGKVSFSDALKLQSDKNAQAAFAGTFAALFQALSIGFPILGPSLGLQ